jgi:hypothetical protein
MMKLCLHIFLLLWFVSTTGCMHVKTDKSEVNIADGVDWGMAAGTTVTPFGPQLTRGQSYVKQTDEEGEVIDFLDDKGMIAAGEGPGNIGIKQVGRIGASLTFGALIRPDEENIRVNNGSTSHGSSAQTGAVNNTNTANGGEGGRGGSGGQGGSSRGGDTHVRGGDTSVRNVAHSGSSSGVSGSGNSSSRAGAGVQNSGNARSNAEINHSGNSDSTSHSNAENNNSNGMMPNYGD